MDVSEAVTLAIAVAGLLLGIRSAWREHKRDRVALRVIPKLAYPIGSPKLASPCLAFEIVNDSTFPVTASEVGVLYHDSEERGILHNPIQIDGGTWPRRLDAMSSVTVYAASGAIREDQYRQIRCAYVTTGNGKVFRGHSPALKVVTSLGAIPPLKRRIDPGGHFGFLTVLDPDVEY
jgi:hypothetical protein